MLDKEKAIGILTINRLIEEGHIIPATDQTAILYWVSYEILQSMEDIDVVAEAEKIMADSIRKNKEI